jgi:NADH:ubiquinone oxidoreductase subunit 6 (subunit J)
MYVVAWLFNYYLLMPDFLEKYSAHMLEEMKAQGASAEKIQKESKEMASFAKMYQNPFFNALMTYVEILPVGVVVTLISAMILKRKHA